eukprot:5706496-Alexandrium_andersonii.AAC.1
MSCTCSCIHAGGPCVGALCAHVMDMLTHTSGPAHHVLVQTLTCRCGGGLVITAIVAQNRALRSLLSVSGGAQGG